MVTSTKVTYSGKTKNGDEYKLYQVIATKPDGTPIPQNLRCFEELERGVVIEVDAEIYRSAQYGDSYTLKRKGGEYRPPAPKTSSVDLDDLLKRVKRIEDFLSGRGEFQGSGGQQRQPPPTQQSSAPPSPPPPAPPPVNPDPPPTRMAGDDDIPF